MQSKVIIDTTGGTIESKERESGLEPVSNKLKKILIEGYEIPVHEILKPPLDSTDIYDKLRNTKIGPTVARQANKGYNVVVSHGTDTLPATAGVLDYNLYGNRRRIVVSGALYPPESTRFDGEINRRDAVFFAMKGYQWSGVFVVMGGNVLSTFLWANHLWELHSPPLEKLRLREEIIAKYQIELHSPSEPIARIEGDLIRPSHQTGPTYDETTYLQTDDVFSISTGWDGKVRSLDFRGYEPPTGEIHEINHLIREYVRIKKSAFDDPEKKHTALSEAELLLNRLGIDPDIFTVYWKNLNTYFDKRTNLSEIFVVGDIESNPLPYIYGIKDGKWAGIIIRGVGHAHVRMKNKEWRKVLRVAREYNVPVAVVSDEGLITSSEYAVAKPLYKAGVNHSGTLNAKEAQIRMAYCIGHKDKRKFLTKVVAEIFDVEPLSVVGAMYVPGTLFKNTEQRNDWAHTHRYSTNLAYTISPLLQWEETAKLAGLNHAYVSGKLESGLKWA